MKKKTHSKFYNNIKFKKKMKLIQFKFNNNKILNQKNKKSFMNMNKKFKMKKKKQIN